ncbi:MAG TPA: ATP-binding protein, partial [Flavisolibacter sp.]
NRTAEANIRTSFLIADSFMEEDQYDSAQLWLNKIATQLPLKEPSLFNYFLASRQAEVYYYNGLQRLGLQEAERSLSIAQKLNDSLLLADSYNFLGLFYINLDSFSKAVPLFYQGISFIRQPPYPERYNNLSMPHHLYGNMAEAFEKKNALDSSIYFSRLSLREAAAAGSSRAMALANYNLGSVFLKQKKADSAFYYFSQSLKVMGDQTDFDVALINYGGLASAADLIQNKVASITWLQKGFGLLHEKTTINNLFKGQFLDGAIVLYEKFSEKDLLVEALHLKADLLSTQTRHQNQQMNSILNAGLQNETRLLNLQVKEAAQQNEIANTRVYLLLLLLILLAAGFLFYRYKIKQKLEVVRLQNKISQDLHDDVGSSLSSLQVYSAVAERLMEDRPAQAKEMLRKIARESSLVLENIGDIVWSIKPGSDQSLEERIKNFVADVLGAANINYRIVIEDGIENTIRNMEARKNILLIIKEAVNNTLKYSKASHVSVNIKKLAGHLCIQIADDGIGFQKESLLRKGAGLSNMEQRTLDLGGIYELITSPGKGTTVSALLPLTKISDSFR